MSAEALLDAIAEPQVEGFRALLPVGYAAGLEAYRRAVASLEVQDLSLHYTRGLSFFQETFVPYLKAILTKLSGGVWSFDDYEACAAGSDVDLITHLVEAMACRQKVCLYPGDWFGFRVGSTHGEGIVWTPDSRGHFCCLCVPSVRNGHLTAEMVDFLSDASGCLLNINLFPTLAKDERHAVATALAPLLPKSILSISFSRGFGLTASQLGVALMHRDNPVRQQLAGQLAWHTYFYNAIAARAMMTLDLERLQAVDEERRRWVLGWLTERSIPAVTSGSYYVRSFRVQGSLPRKLEPLVRDSLVRLCFKPLQS